MRRLDTLIPGAYVLDLERRDDERGFFATMWTPQLFASLGLTTDVMQCSVAFNHRAGTLRGMHYQAAPHEEVKIVRCSRGALYDVLVDLRPDSPTYKRWIGVELTPLNDRVLYVPKGIAHGYQTLVDDTEITYLISETYTPSHGRGVRWNDPAFSIDWPAAGARIINARDAGYPDFAG